MVASNCYLPTSNSQVSASALHSIDLRDNSIGPAAVPHLVEYLGSSSALTNLDVSANSLDEAAKARLDAVGDERVSTVLDLEGSGPGPSASINRRSRTFSLSI